MARILVFDASPKRMVSYVSMLAGNDVIGNADLSCAIRPAVILKPDIILADWFDSDGPKLIDELRRVPRYPVPPVFLMEDIASAGKPAAFRKAARARNAAGFIPRPVSRERLFLIINATLLRDEL